MIEEDNDNTAADANVYEVYAPLMVTSVAEPSANIAVAPMAVI